MLLSSVILIIRVRLLLSSPRRRLQLQLVHRLLAQASRKACSILDRPCTACLKRLTFHSPRATDYPTAKRFVLHPQLHLLDPPRTRYEPQNICVRASPSALDRPFVLILTPDRHRRPSQLLRRLPSAKPSNAASFLLFTTSVQSSLFWELAL